MWQAPRALPSTLPQWAVAATLLILPAGFYIGWVDYCWSHVLYSDNEPYGLITSESGPKFIARFSEMEVPFPHAHRLLRQYFERTAKAGSKLHIADPRPWVGDAYYLKQADGTAIEIDRERFLSSAAGAIAGIEVDDPRSVFALSRGGARMLKRTADAMIYAVEITPDHYQAALLDHVHGLPNLEQLQLRGCQVTDDDLSRLEGCGSLIAIGLDDTNVTDEGIRLLSKLPKLNHFELQNTNTSKALRHLLEKD